MDSVDEIPSAVTWIAGRKRFGRLVADRKAEHRPVLDILVFATLGAPVVVGFALLLGWVSRQTMDWFAPIANIAALWAGLAFCGVLPVVLVSPLLLMGRATRGYYLYERGLVGTWNGLPRAARWQQGTKIIRHRADPPTVKHLRGQMGFKWASTSTIVGFDIRPARRPTIRVQVEGTARMVFDEAYFDFCDDLERLAVQGGATITG